MHILTLTLNVNAHKETVWLISSSVECHMTYKTFQLKTITQSYHRSDETLILWRFTSEAVTHKANFGDHSLPGFLLSLPSSDDFEHFCLSLGTNLWQGHLPFALNRKHYMFMF